MKKAICLVLAIMVCMAFVGCGKTADDRSGVVNQGKSVNDVLNDGMKNGDFSQQGENQTSDPKQQTKPVEDVPSEYQTVDVDLTKLNSTMVYSEVYNMMTSPENYMGKKVKMSGTFNYAAGDNRYYYACLIADATACCAQGIEFVLKMDRTFPDEYPKVGDAITVVGIFDTYYEGSNRYCQLIDAYMG